MARRRGATFTGSPPPDVGRGSSIFNRWIAAVADDAGLLWDKLTGQNAEPDPINHSGGGALRGAPICLPLGCSAVMRSANVTGSSKLAAPTYLLAIPVFVPDDGNQAYRLEFRMSFSASSPIFAEVRDMSWAALSGPFPAPATDPYGAWNLILGPGLQFVLVWCDDDVGAQRFMNDWVLYPITGHGNGAGPTSISGTSTGNPIPVGSIAVSSWVDTFDEQVSAAGPLDAYTLTRLNRNINGLLEYVMGGPVPGNASYSTSPSRRNNGTSFANEAVIQSPVSCMSFGAVQTSGAPAIDSALTSGMLDWFAPQAAAGTTPSLVTVGGEAWTMRPHAFANTTRAAVLAASSTGTPTALTASVNGSTSAAFVRLGSSNFYLASIPSVPTTGGAMNGAGVRISKASSVAFGELSVLGACIYVG